ncbi:MAG: hypothetical protein JSR44_02985, partial [Spirochaetes bacterium]|nr:hypothetical protein [Spirochaetota bacterium]
ASYCTQNSTLLSDTATTLQGSNAAGASSANATTAQMLRSIWIVGGTKTAGLIAPTVAVGAMANNLDYFDPLTNTWTTLTSAQWTGTFTSRIGAAVVGLNGKIYVIGGYGEGASAATALNTNTVQIFDIATTTWSTGATLANVNALGAPVVVGSNIYVVGGTNSANVAAALGAASAQNLQPVNIYNTTANSWSQGTVLVAAQSGVDKCAFTPDGVSIYHIGGRTAAATVAATAANGIYNSLTNAPGIMTFDTTGYTARTGSACVAFKTISGTYTAVSIGGYSVVTATSSGLMGGAGTTALTAVSTVFADVFPFTGGTWGSLSNLPAAQAYSAAVIKDGVIYVFGGNTATVPATAVSNPVATVYTAATLGGSWSSNAFPPGALAPYNAGATIAAMPSARWGHGAVLVQ